MMQALFVGLLAAACLLCTDTRVQAADAGPFRDVYVLDFQSDDPANCTAADVDVDHQRAATFFQRARKISSRAIHDYYDTFPCRAVGVLRLHGQQCTWTLNAGLHATVRCQGKESHYACDDCQALLTPAAPR